MPMRVLIVDDSAVIRESLRRLFNSEGFSVCDVAEDGAQAIEKAGQTHPDLIVLDYSMPVMNGIETARMMHNTMPDMPILMLTAHFTAAEAASKDLGIKGVFSKDNVEPLLMQTRTVLKL